MVTQWGLGVTLKCTCQPLSVSYSSIGMEEAKRGVSGLPLGTLNQMQELKSRLPPDETPLVLIAECGAVYLTSDSASLQRQIGHLHDGVTAVTQATLREDKQHNRNAAARLVERGVGKTLQSCCSRGAVSPAVA